MNKIKPQKIIVEGGELTGKSFIISQLYNILEPELNSGKAKLLDGCHWFNCDVGIFGTDYGSDIIKQYIKIAEIIQHSHLIFEKFHISDQIYNFIYHNKDVNYKPTEAQLIQQGFKLVLLYIDNDKKLFEQRLQDRLKLYPHYQRIAQSPGDYIIQQNLYLERFEQSQLPKLKINTTNITDSTIIDKIISWLKTN